MSEHDFETTPGLPEALPTGEKLLWQGAPPWRLLVRRVFHVDKFAAYFGALLAADFLYSLASGVALAESIARTGRFAMLAAGALALLSAIAWLNARSTVYTLTTRRIVIRHGAAVTINLNVPFDVIDAAEMKAWSDGSGEIALRLAPHQRVGYLITWPHVRRWRFLRPEPTLRALPDIAQVSERVQRAWREYAEARMKPSSQAVAA